MGMSASQARYLALTARMNDIEYQGQQINQQRTTLSNQINELYNSLLDIDVPTPPSTKDYTKLVYSGNYNAGKFSLGTVTPGQDAGTYSVDFNYTNTGHYWARGTQIKLNRGKTYYQIQPNWQGVDAPISSSNQYKLVGTNEQLAQLDIDLSKKITNESIESKSDEDVYVEMTGEQYKNFMAQFGDAQGSSFKVYEIANPSVADASQYTLEELTNDGGSVKDKVQNSKKYIIQMNYSDYASAINTAVDQTDDSLDSLRGVLSNVDVYSVKDESGNVKTNGSLESFASMDSIDENTLANLLPQGCMISNGTSCHAPTKEDFQIVNGKIMLKEGLSIGFSISQAAADKLAESEFFTNGREEDTTVGVSGNISLNMDLSDLLDSDYLETSEGQAYLDGLKNAFAKEWADTKPDVQSFLKLFAFYETTKESTHEPVYHIVKKSDLTGGASYVNTYEYTPNGTYTSTRNEGNCKLEFGNDGRITSVGIPNADGTGWDFVPVTMTEETDTDAYEEAFNQYEYEKFKYDKKQQEINAKTSIIQQEDKNLELKLTRLDNERNAVNTELEAVKKVITDNIDKSYKTFSG